MLDHKDMINVVDELNDHFYLPLILDINLETEGFNYITQGDYKLITFDDTPVWNSDENDDKSFDLIKNNDKEGFKMLLVDRLLQKHNILVKFLNHFKSLENVK